MRLFETYSAGLPPESEVQLVRMQGVNWLLGVAPTLGYMLLTGFCVEDVQGGIFCLSRSGLSMQFTNVTLKSNITRSFIKKHWLS